MSSSYFPLRWESTGDQWWYASPIDWAAASGHYDLVRELLHLDSNLLIKLTSLRRIQRLESVWDDEAQFKNVAQCRSEVARKLFTESETKEGDNSLIRAGYGGWLLYTAASAGDVSFVKELLQRDPILVFGQGEYGVTDIFYAASRSKNSQLFRLLFGFSASPRSPRSGLQELEEPLGEDPSVFKWEMTNRGLHAAARGGNLEILKELLEDCTDVLAYRDVNDSTILHSASGTGQTQVVKDLVASFNMITSTDNQGNTALHVAAFHGYVAAVEALILLSPSSAYLTNISGDTFLHMAVAGFQSPGLRRIDRHIELMRQLVFWKCVNMQHIINVRNNNGKTALHIAVVGIVNSTLLEGLLNVPSVDLDIHDLDGMTPLDILRQQPLSISSEILTKHLISGGRSPNYRDFEARGTIVTHLKMQGLGSSPGTSFRTPDTNIVSHTGTETFGANIRLTSSSSDSNSGSNNSDNKKRGSVTHARNHLKTLLRWPQKNRSSESILKAGDEESVDRNKKCSDMKVSEKEMLLITNGISSPTTKKKSSPGLMQGAMQAIPHISHLSQSPCTSSSRSSICSPVPLDKQKVVHTGQEITGPSCSGPSLTEESTSASKSLMDQYFCFGAQDVIMGTKTRRSHHHKGFSVPSVT